MSLTRRAAIGVLAGSGRGRGDRRAGHAGRRRGGGVIRRDVCVVGGGSSGTYTAVRLRDLGRSVVVVESLGRLGGHCETFHDLPLVREYFARFDVPLVGFGGFRETPV
jgi:hypothetical protein